MAAVVDSAALPPLSMGDIMIPRKAPPVTLLSALRRIWHPLIIYDAYTFRWLGFDPHEHENTREQAFTKVTNVGLISALVLTVWTSWIQVVATTSFESYGTHWGFDIKGIAGAFLCTGTFFLLFSVINSVLVLLAVNETENDCQATTLLVKLDLWFTLPSIYFYLGVGFGSFGFLLWFPAVFPIRYATYNIVAGLGIVAANAPYYQFLILSVYDMRQEHGLAIPAPPKWVRQLGLCRVPASHQVKSSVALTKKSEDASNVSEAFAILHRALQEVGQAALVEAFASNGWDHLDALAEMREHHVSAITTLKPGHIVRFLRRLRSEVELHHTESNHSTLEAELQPRQSGDVGNEVAME